MQAFQSWKPDAPLGRDIDPETKLLLIRLCAALNLGGPVWRAFRDSDPAARWLAVKTMNEMEGLAKPKRHDLMLRRAARFGQAFREGRAQRIPWRFEDQHFGTCDRNGCDQAAS